MARTGFPRSLPQRAPGNATPSEEEGAGHWWCRAHPEVPSLSLPPDIWTAHSGLFAQGLAFAQVFNSLHWLEENTSRWPRRHLWAAIRRSGAGVA